ncbi:hypothetical protein INN71_09420 [Nocardioides sp. ChNu-153]|uniref:hypothetical protein n=1 Tax=unclassified Nocardioides TaxID=2615069 RepID=UPI0024058E1A|nr:MULTISPECIES: hypothetical protein [unclassified Nocardioides]MDF9716218.1 hypothetical protein [Nocardioides sp. ChNu-99]MDN7121608.1 hypothetical protein [Nocardioides sp. ChNu-153]
MGSRYDIAVLRRTSLAELGQALGGVLTVGDQAVEPWAGPSGVTVAQVDGAAESAVVVLAAPMKLPRGVDTRLVRRLGTEALFATVWDSVGVYSLRVVGDGIDREITADPDDGMHRRGTSLPEEPSWPEVDEAYVQTVLRARCGIDPGAIQDVATTWFPLLPSPSSDR